MGDTSVLPPESLGVNSITLEMVETPLLDEGAVVKKNEGEHVSSGLPPFESADAVSDVPLQESSIIAERVESREEAAPPGGDFEQTAILVIVCWVSNLLCALFS